MYRLKTIREVTKVLSAVDQLISIDKLEDLDVFRKANRNDLVLFRLLERRVRILSSAWKMQDETLRNSGDVQYSKTASLFRRPKGKNDGKTVEAAEDVVKQLLLLQIELTRCESSGPAYTHVAFVRQIRYWIRKWINLHEPSHNL